MGLGCALGLAAEGRAKQQVAGLRVILPAGHVGPGVSAQPLAEGGGRLQPLMPECEGQFGRVWGKERGPSRDGQL